LGYLFAHRLEAVDTNQAEANSLNVARRVSDLPVLFLNTLSDSLQDCMPLTACTHLRVGVDYILGNAIYKTCALWTGTSSCWAAAPRVYICVSHLRLVVELHSSGG
jgi:hypothetical protein